MSTQYNCDSANVSQKQESRYKKLGVFTNFNNPIMLALLQQTKLKAVDIQILDYLQARIKGGNHIITDEKIACNAGLSLHQCRNIMRKLLAVSFNGTPLISFTGNGYHRRITGVNVPPLDPLSETAKGFILPVIHHDLMKPTAKNGIFLTVNFLLCNSAATGHNSYTAKAIADNTGQSLRAVKYHIDALKSGRVMESFTDACCIKPRTYSVMDIEALADLVTAMTTYTPVMVSAKTTIEKVQKPQSKSAKTTIEGCKNHNDSSKDLINTNKNTNNEQASQLAVNENQIVEPVKLKADKPKALAGRTRRTPRTTAAKLLAASSAARAVDVKSGPSSKAGENIEVFKPTTEDEWQITAMTDEAKKQDRIFKANQAREQRTKKPQRPIKPANQLEIMEEQPSVNEQHQDSDYNRNLKALDKYRSLGLQLPNHLLMFEKSLASAV